MTRVVGLEERMATPDVVAAWRKHDPHLADRGLRWTVNGSAAAPLLDLGWHYQTGIGVLRMNVAGVFDRFPDLQMIIGHWGEMVLFFLDRIQLLTSAQHLQRPVSERFRHHVHITPGWIGSHRDLRWAMEVVGAHRILHATTTPSTAPPTSPHETSWTPPTSATSTARRSPQGTGTASLPASGGDGLS